MTRILQITCSPRGRESHSTSLSDGVVDLLFKAYPDATLACHDLCDPACEPIDATYATHLVAGRDESDPMSGALERSAAAISQLMSADIVVIGTPMHNFTVPSVLKGWIDLVVRVFHTFTLTPNGKVGLVSDRPVYIAIASGGVFHGKGANQPDFLTPYLTAVLGCIGLTSLHMLPLQGTATKLQEELAQQKRQLLDQAERIIGTQAGAVLWQQPDTATVLH